METVLWGEGLMSLFLVNWGMNKEILPWATPAMILQCDPKLFFPAPKASVSVKLCKSDRKPLGDHTMTAGTPTHAGGHCHSSGSSGAVQGTDQALALDAHGKFGYDPCKSQSGRPPISWELLLGRHQLNPLPEGLSQHFGGTSRPDFGGSNGGGSRLTWIWVSQRGRLWLNLEMSVPGLCFEQPHSPPHSPLLHVHTVWQWVDFFPDTDQLQKLSLWYFTKVCGILTPSS